MRRIVLPIVVAIVTSGCDTRYRVVSVRAPATEALARVDAEARAAGVRSVSTVALGDGETRVILESASKDANRAVLAGLPATEAVDHMSTERDMYSNLRERAHFAPYFNYTVGKSPAERTLDHRFYFGAFLVVPVATWGDTMGFEPSHRRRLWLGVGGDLGVSVGDDPVGRGYLAIHYQHGEVRSLDGKTQIQSSVSYSYQLAISMLRVGDPARTEVMLVAPMAALGVVAQVGWNWADQREVAWSVGLRIPLPFHLGAPTGPIRVPQVSASGGR